jgi:hypothetical protein
MPDPLHLTGHYAKVVLGNKLKNLHCHFIELLNEGRVDAAVNHFLVVAEVLFLHLNLCIVIIYTVVVVILGGKYMKVNVWPQVNQLILGIIIVI